MLTQRAKRGTNAHSEVSLGRRKGAGLTINRSTNGRHGQRVIHTLSTGCGSPCGHGCSHPILLHTPALSQSAVHTDLQSGSLALVQLMLRPVGGAGGVRAGVRAERKESQGRATRKETCFSSSRSPARLCPCTSVWCSLNAVSFAPHFWLSTSKLHFISNEFQTQTKYIL